MIIKTRFLLLVLLLLGLGLGRMVSVSATPVGEQGDSGPTAASILNTHCVSCHGPSQQLSGLRLDARSSLLEGGYSGPAIIPGNSNDSALVHRLISEREGYRMPMGAPPLTGLQIDTLRTWIDRGAPWQEEASVPAKADAPSAEGQEHWSFQPVVRPAIPPLRNRSWARSPIDAFVLSRLEAEGISPSREASKEALFRRVNLDLTGLLPTRQEQNIFGSSGKWGGGTWFGAFRIPNLVPRSLVNIVGCSSSRGNCGKLRAMNWASKPVIRSFPSAVRTVEKQLRALASSPPELLVFPRFA